MDDVGGEWNYVVNAEKSMPEAESIHLPPGPRNSSADRRPKEPGGKTRLKRQVVRTDL
jgi:hypothetical protein